MTLRLDDPRFPIGALSSRTGCSIETIRYYERIGLLPAPPRSAGGHRVYDLDHLKRLTFIRRSRALGFTLDQVRGLLGLVDGGDFSCDDIRRLTLAHLGEIRDKIAELMIHAETMRAFGSAAIQQFEMVEGVAVPNNLIANTGKYHATSGYHRAVEILQDIAGGGLITSPSAADLNSPLTGPLVEKYFVGAREVSAAERLLVLIERQP